MRKITLLFAAFFAVVVVNAQTLLFNENFNNVNTTIVADANGNIAGSRDIAAVSKLDSAIVTNPGWTGTKVYISDKKLKMGTSSAMGTLTTGPINLSTSSFIITLDIASWNNTGNVADTGSSIDILIDGSLVSTISYTTVMTTYSTPIITSKTSASKISFAAKVSKNRFFIDNVSVTSSTGISNPSASKLEAIVSGKNLLISNVSNGSQVEIFSALGSKVQTSVLENGKVSIANLKAGIYVVRSGKLTQKIKL